MADGASGEAPSEQIEITQDDVRCDVMTAMWEQAVGHETGIRTLLNSYLGLLKLAPSDKASRSAEWNETLGRALDEMKERVNAAKRFPTIETVIRAATERARMQIRLSLGEAVCACERCKLVAEADLRETMRRDNEAAEAAEAAGAESELVDLATRTGEVVLE